MLSVLSRSGSKEKVLGLPKEKEKRVLSIAPPPKDRALSLLTVPAGAKGSLSSSQPHTPVSRGGRIRSVSFRDDADVDVRYRKGMQSEPASARGHRGVSFSEPADRDSPDSEDLFAKLDDRDGLDGDGENEEEEDSDGSGNSLTSEYRRLNGGSPVSGYVDAVETQITQLMESALAVRSEQ